MGPDATAPQPPDRRDEFDRAFDHFRSLLDLSQACFMVHPPRF